MPHRRPAKERSGRKLYRPLLMPACAGRPPGLSPPAPSEASAIAAMPAVFFLRTGFGGIVARRMVFTLSSVPDLILKTGFGVAVGIIVAPGLIFDKIAGVDVGTITVNLLIAVSSDFIFLRSLFTPSA